MYPLFFFTQTCVSLKGERVKKKKRRDKRKKLKEALFSKCQLSLSYSKRESNKQCSPLVTFVADDFFNKNNQSVTSRIQKKERGGIKSTLHF